MTLLKLDEHIDITVRAEIRSQDGTEEGEFSNVMRLAERSQRLLRDTYGHRLHALNITLFTPRGNA